MWCVAWGGVVTSTPCGATLPHFSHPKVLENSNSLAVDIKLSVHMYVAQNIELFAREKKPLFFSYLFVSLALTMLLGTAMVSIESGGFFSEKKSHYFLVFSN